MKIVFAASEAAPFIKTGGLGDVAAALPAALSDYKGNEVLLFLPYYSKIKNNKNIVTETVAEFEVDMAWRKCYVGLRRLKSKKRKLKVFFIDNDYYFGNRENIYGDYDDGERFAFFSRAILDSLVKVNFCPDIIHCNDWQTALIPVLLHAFYNSKLGYAKTVFTIHNIEYQGWTAPDFLGEVAGLPERYTDTFEFNGVLNFVKGAILTCDALTTVSRTYASEICYPYYAHGLSDVIKEHSFKLFGIVNGIDVVENDPSKDDFLPCKYGPVTFADGKRECKKHLIKEVGLEDTTTAPLIGMVSRLVGHKGLDILCDAIDDIMKKDVRMVILGTGDAVYENKLKEYEAKYPGKMSVNLRFSRELASRIYAASDIYMMPSKSEPCGLSQLIAMRYGAVPLVHETGGLKDTVIPFDRQSQNGLGFTFGDFTKQALVGTFEYAFDIYQNDKQSWNKLVINGMTEELSWKRSAEEYMRLYNNR